MVSDRRGGDDHDPDPAALDELRRAFADQESSSAPDAAATTDRIDAMEATRPAAGPVDDARSDDDVTPPHDAPDGAADPDPVDEGPAILSADLPGVEQPTDQGRIDVMIVEQEPLEADESTPPRIIRIDGYGGSNELPPSTPAHGRPRPGPAIGTTSGATSPSEASDATPRAAGLVPGDPIIGIASGDAVPDEGRSHGGPGVISISDDELPDPVYVEGSLDRDGGGTIVIIEDDDTGDALAPESERDLRRGIEPRMRERRVAVKRAQGRRRLKRFGLVVAGVLVVVAVLAVLGSPLFAVRADEVRVFNAVYTDEVALQAIIDDAVGTPVLRVDTAKIEEEIEEISWVEAAAVRTEFPHGLVVEIREREAISTYQGPDQRFRVLDRDGRVLDVLDLYPYAYVLIGGPDSVDLAPGEFAPQGYAAASELAKHLTPAVRGRVTLIEVNAEGSRLAMNLDDGSTVFFGEARDLLAKLVRLGAVLANGQEREPGLIDVSTADVTR